MEDDIKFLNRLNRHPHIKARLDSLLCIAEAEAEISGNADEVEIQLQDAVRELGRQTLNDWALSYESQKTAMATEDKKMKKHGKKKPIGTQHSV